MAKLLNEPSTKFCSKCQAETERYARGQCKPCNKTSATAWRAANPEKHKVSVNAYYARNKEKHKANVDAWRTANHDKHRARNAAYRAACKASHPEKQKAYSAAWAAAHPEVFRIKNHNRRARKLANGGTLSRGLAEKLFKLQKGKCACCQQPLGKDYHLDHRMPLALGGSNTDDNMQLLRKLCNLQKSNRHPIDFMQSRGFLL